MSAHSILIVEDDEHLRLTLADNLEDEGYHVHLAETGEAALALLDEHTCDLVILDIMLPGMDGYGVCRALRARERPARILMLTARSLEDDVVRGLEIGADDYLAKPYRLRELLARVKALLRRGGGPEVSSVLRFGPWRLDPEARIVQDDAGEIALTRTEFDMLHFLLRHPGRALSRDEILDAVWGADVVVDPRTVDNFISNLKKKLRWAPGCGFALQTVRGIGYRMILDR